MSLSQDSFFFYSIKMKKQNPTSAEAVALLLYLQFHQHLVGIILLHQTQVCKSWSILHLEDGNSSRSIMKPEFLDPSLDPQKEVKQNGSRTHIQVWRSLPKFDFMTEWPNSSPFIILIAGIACSLICHPSCGGVATK